MARWFTSELADAQPGSSASWFNDEDDFHANVVLGFLYDLIPWLIAGYTVVVLVELFRNKSYSGLRYVPTIISLIFELSDLYWPTTLMFFLVTPVHICGWLTNRRKGLLGSIRKLRWSVHWILVLVSIGVYNILILNQNVARLPSDRMRFAFAEFGNFFLLLVSMFWGSFVDQRAFGNVAAIIILCCMGWDCTSHDPRCTAIPQSCLLFYATEFLYIVGDMLFPCDKNGTHDPSDPEEPESLFCPTWATKARELGVCDICGGLLLAEIFLCQGGCTYCGSCFNTESERQENCQPCSEKGLAMKMGPGIRNFLLEKIIQEATQFDDQGD